jgi:cathepsin L
MLTHCLLGPAQTIESAIFLATGQLFTLSEQAFVSCTPNPQHCGGTGLCDLAGSAG